MANTSAKVDVQGTWAPGFDPVREAFQANFDEGAEVGASCAVRVRGRTVVDLWGGHTAPGGSPWQADTIVNMMSVAKGLAALVIHILAERGSLDLDTPIARYWPEFAAAGKEAILVRHALAHTAGLEVLDEPLWPGAAYDWNAMIGAIERQAPLHPAGQQPAYHTVTYSYLLGELVRRVTGKSYGRVLRELVTEPLGLDYHVGLSLPDHARCARFIRWTGYNQATTDDVAHGPSDLLIRAWAQFDPETDDDYNSAQFRLAEIPGVNGHGNARAIALLYGDLASGASTLIGEHALARARELAWEAREPVLGHDYRMGLGFTLNSPDAYMGPHVEAFGHVGAGGSTGFADPVERVGFSYGMNLMAADRDNGPRARRILDALYGVLARAGG